jgi:hypothetical protein
MDPQRFAETVAPAVAARTSATATVATAATRMRDERPVLVMVKRCSFSGRRQMQSQR